MGKAIVVGGDAFNVDPSFGDAKVTGKLKNDMVAVGGGGRVKIQGQPACVQGDELMSVLLPGLVYTAGAHSAGVGLVHSASVDAKQVSKHVSVNGRKVILADCGFDALFQALSPAKDPSGVPDPMAAAPRRGKGKIQAAKTKVKAL
jgi:hypothetical protein